MSNYENTIDHIGRYHWLVSSIATIMIFMIANRLNSFDMKISSFYKKISSFDRKISSFDTKVNSFDKKNKRF